MGTFPIPFRDGPCCPDEPHLIPSELAAILSLMERRTEEWLRQSEYDMETADYLYRGGRYMYAVFMCHLAIEKALKGLYFERLRQVPPKSPHLLFLLAGVGGEPTE